MREPTTIYSTLEVEQKQIFRDFEEFIILKDHPCLMAQSIFSSQNLDFNVYPGLGSRGKAFYMVGMHPNSSRKSRQAPYPAIAFNLHLQFEKLREKGRYEQVKHRIRDRDIELQGNMNPMLQDFHEGSEARQYSGRKVGEEWKCPFLHKKNKNVPAQEISENR